MARDHQNWPFHPLSSTAQAITVVAASGNSNGQTNRRKKSKTLLKRHQRYQNHRQPDDENEQNATGTHSDQQQISYHQQQQANVGSIAAHQSGAITTSQNIHHSGHLGSVRSEHLLDGSSSLSTSMTMGLSCSDFRAPGGRLQTTATNSCLPIDNANSDLPFQPADIVSYSQTLGRQYSSSQAQLQSLTSPNFANSCASNVDTSRKTPIGNHRGACLLQQKQFRSQQSLVTRPPTIVSSVLNDSSSSLANITQQQQLAAATTTTFASVQSAATAQMVAVAARQQQQQQQHQTLSQRQLHLLAATSHPAATNTSINGNNISIHPLPPPYSATESMLTTSMHPQQQQLQPAVNATSTHPIQNMNGRQQQQQVQAQNSVAICQQPICRPSTPFPNGGADAGNEQQQQRQQQATNRPARVPSSSILSLIPAQSAQVTNQTTANQQQVMNYPLNQVPSTITSNHPSINNQQYQALVHYQQHQRQADTAASRCLHQHQQQQQQPTIVGISKSKSCLACADISIKWYIVVIALLGLICALIGTIVGAVHSAGRDYISLALLLIGVGLVFIAISWVALKITINTYKSNRQDRRSSLRAQTQAQMGRLFGATNHHQSTGSLHRALLNERLCMMAAAAAMMQSRQQQQACSQGGAQQVAAHNEASQRPQHPAAGNGRLLRYIKRHLPRRLARLLPERLLAAEAPQSPTRDRQSANGSATDGQTLVNPNAANASPSSSSSSLSWTRRPPNERSQLNSGATNSQQQQQQAALTAMFLQHYQQQQQQCQPTLMAPHGLMGPFLFAQPPPPPPPQLFGLAAAGLMGPEYSYRPPPPSYNASMQDLRVRALMQERTNAGIVQWQATNPIYMSGVQQQPQQRQSQCASNNTPVHQPDSGADGGQTEQNSENSTEAANSADDSQQQQQGQPTTIVIESQRAKETTATTAAPNLRRIPSTSADNLRNADNAAQTKSGASTPAIAGDVSAGNLCGSTTVVSIGQDQSAREQNAPARDRANAQICEIKTLGYL